MALFGFIAEANDELLNDISILSLQPQWQPR